MPYKCVHCSRVYEDSSKQVLTGCDGCGGKFFFYLRREQYEQIKQSIQPQGLDLTPTEKAQIEKDVREISGIKDEEIPVFLDFESIKVIKPGKYLVDLANLFSMDKPRVYKLEDGKYIVDLSSKMMRK